MFSNEEDPESKFGDWGGFYLFLRKRAAKGDSVNPDEVVLPDATKMKIKFVYR